MLLLIGWNSIWQALNHGFSAWILCAGPLSAVAPAPEEVSSREGAWAISAE